MHLSHPETIPSPPLGCGKIVFLETIPWCPEARGPWLQTTLLSSVRQNLLGVPLSWVDPLQFSSVAQSCRTLCDPVNCSTPARQASLSITNSRSLLKLMSIQSVMPSSHLILCHPLLLLLPVPPSIRVFSNESTLRMRWPKYSPAAKAPASLGIPSPTRSREPAPLSPRAMDAARSEPSVVPRRPHPWWLRPWEATLVPEGKGEGPLGVRGGFPP